jgi:hypothetical protein
VEKTQIIHRSKSWGGWFGGVRSNDNSTKFKKKNLFQIISKLLVCFDVILLKIKIYILLEISPIIMHP